MRADKPVIQRSGTRMIKLLGLQSAFVKRRPMTDAATLHIVVYRSFGAPFNKTLGSAGTILPHERPRPHEGGAFSLHAEAHSQVADREILICPGPLGMTEMNVSSRRKYIIRVLLV